MRADPQRSLTTGGCHNPFLSNKEQSNLPLGLLGQEVEKRALNPGYLDSETCAFPTPYGVQEVFEKRMNE